MFKSKEIADGSKETQSRAAGANSNSGHVKIFSIETP
jgi:hypothetical protein